MPGKHKLFLDIPIVNNPFLFNVADKSLYTEGLGVTCGELFITVPGFTDPVTFPVAQGFNTLYNACDLGLQVDCSTILNTLPDGIYIVRYAVAPGASVFVEYNFLRLTNIDNAYYNELSSLELAMQDPDPDIKDMLKELHLIRDFLDAAKAKVEVQLQAQDGVDLLTYANKRLKKFMDLCY